MYNQVGCTCTLMYSFAALRQPLGVQPWAGVPAGKQLGPLAMPPSLPSFPLHACLVSHPLQNSTEQLDRLEKAFDEVKARLLQQVGGCSRQRLASTCLRCFPCCCQHPSHAGACAGRLAHRACGRPSPRRCSCTTRHASNHSSNNVPWHRPPSPSSRAPFFPAVVRLLAASRQGAATDLLRRVLQPAAAPRPARQDRRQQRRQLPCLACTGRLLAVGGGSRCRCGGARGAAGWGGRSGCGTNEQRQQQRLPGAA